MITKWDYRLPQDPSDMLPPQRQPPRDIKPLAPSWQHGWWSSLFLGTCLLGLVAGGDALALGRSFLPYLIAIGLVVVIETYCALLDDIHR